MERSKFETFGRTFGPGCQWSVMPRTLGIPKGRIQFCQGCAPGGTSMSPIRFYREFRPILILNGAFRPLINLGTALSHIERHRTTHCRVSATANAASPSLGIFPFRPDPVFLRVSRSCSRLAAGPFDHSDHSPAGSDDDQYTRIETPPNRHFKPSTDASVFQQSLYQQRDSGAVADDQ